MASIPEHNAIGQAEPAVNPLSGEIGTLIDKLGESIIACDKSVENLAQTLGPILTPSDGVKVEDSPAPSPAMTTVGDLLRGKVIQVESILDKINLINRHVAL